MTNFIKSCRLCTSYDDVSSNLHNVDTDNMILSDKLNSIAPGIIEPDIELPNGICTTCVAQLNLAYNFIRKCWKSQDILKQYLKKSVNENSEKKFIDIDQIKTEKLVDDTNEENKSDEKEEINYCSTVLHEDPEIIDFNNTVVDVEESFKFEQICNDTKHIIFEESVGDEDEDTTSLRSFVCEICNKSYRSSLALKQHMWTHKHNQCYKCGVCEKYFTAKGSLKTHIRLHTLDKPFQCKICGKSFTQNGNLKMHIRTHTNERPFRCKTCSKSFARNGDLIQHRRIHSNDKPCKCNRCDKAFARNRDLIRHIRTHTNERPFVCDVCERAFSRNDKLKNHIRTVHGC